MGRRRSVRKFSEKKAQAHLEKYPLTHPCPDCGKYRYMTRQGAKNARRRIKGSDRMSVYLCGEYWHVGHTPRNIRDGYDSRSNTLTAAS